jgi:hypothetical protein
MLRKGGNAVKLLNSTDFPTHFLRRMVAWCCRQVEYPVSCVREAQFRNRTSSCYSGHAYGSRRIVASVGPASMFPFGPDSRPGLAGMVLTDRLECLIAITSHELAHLHQYANRRTAKLKSRVEFDARWHEVKALEAFRVSRERLVAEWSAEPERSAALSAPKPSLIEQRAAKAAADLVRWQRKLKLALTKVRQYRRKVTYCGRLRR